jgi:Ca-activated chloride channel family protein
MDEHLSLSTRIVLTPRRAGLCAGQDNLVEVLVRIQAPDAPQGHVAERPAQAIALVLDRSGSMAGRPIEEARRCAEYVVSKLRSTDRAALVQFDSLVERLSPAFPVGDGTLLRAAIAGIRPGGNTHLHGGWREGAESLAEVPGSGLKRVILLSDGEANEGLTDAAAIAEQCAQWAARGISTSTYGLGESFNEDLMVAMARSGGGNHYYGYTAKDLMDPFQQELELLGNLCLRDLRITARVPDGVEVAMVNALPSAKGGWRLPDLAWGAEAWAVLRLKLSVVALRPVGELMSLVQVSVEARSLEGEAVQLERAGLALPVFSPAGFDGLGDDELVTRRLVELAAADALTRMRTAAGRQDWATVDRLLEQASRRFAGNQWVGALLEAMKSIANSRSREWMMKESMYSSSRLRSRLVAKNEDLQFSAASEAFDRPSYLRRKPAQGKASE